MKRSVKEVCKPAIGGRQKWEEQHQSGVCPAGGCPACPRWCFLPAEAVGICHCWDMPWAFPPASGNISVPCLQIMQLKKAGWVCAELEPPHLKEVPVNRNLYPRRERSLCIARGLCVCRELGMCPGALEILGVWHWKTV